MDSAGTFQDPTEWFPKYKRRGSTLANSWSSLGASARNSEHARCSNSAAGQCGLYRAVLLVGTRMLVGKKRSGHRAPSVALLRRVTVEGLWDVIAYDMPSYKTGSKTAGGKEKF